MRRFGMARISKKEKKWIQETFGKRANFNRTERVLYSHDIAAVPNLFKPLVGNTVPDVVPLAVPRMIAQLRGARP